MKTETDTSTVPKTAGNQAQTRARGKRGKRSVARTTAQSPQWQRYIN